MICLNKKTEYNNYNNIFSYYYAIIKGNGIVSLALRGVRYVRRYLFITRLLGYISAIIAFIETSAVLVVALTAFIIFLPATALILGITMLINKRRYKHFDPDFERDIKSAEKIVIIEAKRGFNFKKPRYINHMADTFIKEGYTVVIISRSLLRDRFTIAQRKSESLWVIKLNYYYAAKKVLDNYKQRTTYIT